MKSMPAGAFQSQFNQLYEQNTVDYASQQRAKKFGWFSDESTDLHVPTNVSKSNFDDSLEQVRRSSTAIIRREGGPTSYNVVSGAGDLYGEDDEDEDAEDVYIACDPFSKLKFRRNIIYKNFDRANGTRDSSNWFTAIQVSLTKAKFYEVSLCPFEKKTELVPS
jgi:hypothetical protein